MAIKNISGGFQTRKRCTAALACLVLGLSCATAYAELSEPVGPAPNPDYFNLFTVTYGSGSGALAGDLTSAADSVWLCGTENCSAGNPDDGGYGYAQFSIDNTAPAGSGYIDPFQRIQHNEGACTGSCDTEQGYNTNNDDLQRIGDIGGDLVEISEVDNQVKDTGAGSGSASDDFNHAIEWETMFIDSEGYLTFMLDINETGTVCNGGGSSCDITSTLRLDELSFFIATTDQLSFYSPDAPGINCAPDGAIDNMCDPQLATGNFLNDPLNTSGDEVFKFWDMDWDEAYAGLLMDNVYGSAGSGDFDVRVRVPVTIELQDFVTENSGDELFVYLYNFMGEADDLVPDGGHVGREVTTSDYESCNNGGNSCSYVAPEDYNATCLQDTGANCQLIADPSVYNADTGAATSGFEEWVYVAGDHVLPPCTDCDGGQIPLPSTAFLFGLGGLLFWRQRRALR